MVNERFDKRENEKESPGKARVILMYLIRGILLFTIFGSIYGGGRPLILWMSGLFFMLTFIPTFIEKQFKIRVPAKFELMIILFVYGGLFAAEVRGLFAGFWWWDILLNFAAAIALGLVGLTVLFVLYKDEKINGSPLIIAVLTFSFAVSIGAVWEIFEFGLDQLFGFNLQKTGLTDTMKDLIVNSIGASIVALAGYFYIRDGKINIISSVVTKFVEMNPKIFGVKSNLMDSSEKIVELIDKGEHDGLEFKSTLRTNLHINQIDKKVEHSALKTITAYLNSNGGTLLIGVSDSGEILGLNNDQFANNDKFGLYFTNLIKHQIGNEYLPFISSKIIKVGEKYLLKVECKKSAKHVFLKSGNEEEFFVRNGPSSSKLNGSALIDYINHNFYNQD